MVTDNLIGSIQDIDDIPTAIKDLYKTAWEVPQKCIIGLAADRGPFVFQSQSMSIHMADPTYKKLVRDVNCTALLHTVNSILQTSMHFYAWGAGLKTGMYYLRTKPATYPIQFGLDPKAPPPSPAGGRSDGGDDTPPLTADPSDEPETSPERPYSALAMYPTGSGDGSNACASQNVQRPHSSMSTYTSVTVCSACVG